MGGSCWVAAYLKVLFYTYVLVSLDKNSRMIIYSSKICRRFYVVLQMYTVQDEKSNVSLLFFLLVITCLFCLEASRIFSWTVDSEILSEYILIFSPQYFCLKCCKFLFPSKEFSVTNVSVFLLQSFLSVSGDWFQDLPWMFRSADIQAP